jgi:hypothetical protein
MSALLSACVVPQANAPTAVQSCSMAGTWADTVTGLGDSVWTIAADGAANETGMDAASGRASIAGHVLRMAASTATGFTGDYEITLDASCNAGQGQLTWTRTPAGVQPRNFAVSFARR